MNANVGIKLLLRLFPPYPHVKVILFLQIGLARLLLSIISIRLNNHLTPFFKLLNSQETPLRLTVELIDL